MRNLKDKSAAFMENGGWSAKLFFPMFPEFLKFLKIYSITIEIGRTVAYLKQGDRVLKLYPHYKGRTNEYMTLTTHKGEELYTFHYTENIETLKSIILTKLL